MCIRDRLSTPADDKKALLAFQLKVDKLRKAVDASSEVLDEDKKRLSFIKSAFKSYPNLDLNYLRNLEELNSKRDNIHIQLYGDPSLSKRDIEQKESIASKVGIIIWNMWRSRSSPSSTNKMLYESASLDFEKVIENLLRVGKKVIVTIPNFGHWKVRLDLLLKGEMPVTKNLPYQWYNTPNLHMCTIQDFYNFCNNKGINIFKTISLNGQKTSKITSSNLKFKIKTKDESWWQIETINL
mgnify:CR=1 FL=1